MSAACTTKKSPAAKKKGALADEPNSEIRRCSASRISENHGDLKTANSKSVWPSMQGIEHQRTANNTSKESWMQMSASEGHRIEMEGRYSTIRKV